MRWRKCLRSTDLIGEVGGHDVGVGLVVADTQPYVALAIEHDERRRAGDQHVHAQVELLAFQQQRTRYVPATMWIFR